MNTRPSGSGTIFAFTGALLAWFAVIAQMYITLRASTQPLFTAIIQFISYFTVLTNIVVAVCFTCIVCNLFLKKELFFVKPAVCTAVTMYITVVGLVYNFILRFLWNPAGMQLLVDELLHTIIPIWTILYWCFFVPKQTLQWKNMWTWLIYPSVYLVYILIRGELSDVYPYPFLDVVRLGYADVLVNCALLSIVFVFFSLLYIGISKWLTRKHKA